jgi:uncharacterized protein YndB with AHSA1/START domain
MATDASAQPATDREIVVTRIIEGPRSIVFDAFSDPDRLGRWWGPNGAAITTRAFDFRPGGVWDASIKGPQGDFPNYVVWKEIAPPERIVWMYYGMGKHDPNPVESTLTLAERGAATEARLRLLFTSKEAREAALKYRALEGAKLTLERLAAAIAPRIKVQ